MARESFKVELVFDDVSGDLVNVVALDGVETPHGSKVELNKLARAGVTLHKATNHSMLFAWGSPGCIVFKTSTGYVQICK